MESYRKAMEGELGGFFPDDHIRAALTGKHFWRGHLRHLVWLPVEEQPIGPSTSAECEMGRSQVT